MKTVPSLLIDGTTEVHFVNGSVIRQRQIAPVDLASEPGVFYTVTVDAVGSFMAASKAIFNDGDLSAAGKTKKLEPLTVAAICQLARSYFGIMNFAAHLDKRFATLVAVPQLLPGDVMNVAVDSEIRTWWRSIGVAERSRNMDRMNQSPELARIELALMRSPIALVDEEISVIRASWERGQRGLNPAEDVAIAAGRSTVEWALRGMAQASAALTAGLEPGIWPRHRILNTIVSCENATVAGGFGAFGFSVTDVAESKRVAAHRAKAGLTA